MIKKLPSMEHTFSVELEGKETGQKYAGTFTYKRPNLRIKSEIAKTTARLNEDLKNLDPDIAFMHEVLATLKHTLAPGDNAPWWINSDLGFNLFDVNVILELYKETQKFEKEWFEKVWSEEIKKEDAK